MNNSAEAGPADAGEKPRRPDRDAGEFIREEPLTALAIAGAAGFILGGGLNNRFGIALMAVVGRIAMRAAAASFIAGMLTGNSETRRPDRARTRGENSGDGKHDNRRTDFGDSQ